MATSASPFHGQQPLQIVYRYQGDQHYEKFSTMESNITVGVP